MGKGQNTKPLKEENQITEGKRNNHKQKEDKPNQKNKKFVQKKFSTDYILEQINYSFSRDAVWFKKTLEKIDKVKADLDQVNRKLFRNFTMNKNVKKKLLL
jgi:hypothetical protein